MKTKVREEVEAKTREEAKKRIIVEEKKKKRILEYIQQLQNKVLAEDATLLKSVKGFQVIESKHKKVLLGDDMDY